MSTTVVEQASCRTARRQRSACIATTCKILHVAPHLTLQAQGFHHEEHEEESRRRNGRADTWHDVLTGPGVDHLALARARRWRAPKTKRKRPPRSPWIARVFEDSPPPGRAGPWPPAGFRPRAATPDRGALSQVLRLLTSEIFAGTEREGIETVVVVFAEASSLAAASSLRRSRALARWRGNRASLRGLRGSKALSRSVAGPRRSSCRRCGRAGMSDRPRAG